MFFLGDSKINVSRIAKRSYSLEEREYMTTGCVGEKAKLALKKEHTIFSTKLI